MSTLYIEQDWEADFIKTGNIKYVPEEDRARVLHELQELCELSRLLIEQGTI